MTKRFNPPPGWPPVPPGWTPPPGWKPPAHFPAPPPGWPLWIDDAETLSSGRWKPSWRLYVPIGLIVLAALVGLAAGGYGALVFGGLVATLVGLAGLVRPAWVGAPNRAATGIAAGAGLALLVAGSVIAPPAPVAVPPPPAASPGSPAPRSPAPIPSKIVPTATAAPSASTTVKPSPTTKPSPAPTKPKPSPTSTRPAAGTALAALQELKVKGRAPKTGYARSEFGSGWATQPTGCDTRQTVLRRDLANVKILATDDCTVIGGKLNDPYTGAAFTAKTTSVDDLEADHIVPASDAWQKGAQQLSSARREAFFNDLLNLQTTLGAVNASKGDGDAATWLPPNTTYRCTYVARQIAVKTRYDLWVTKAEKAAMQRVLLRCPTQTAADDGQRPEGRRQEADHGRPHREEAFAAFEDRPAVPDLQGGERGRLRAVRRRQRSGVRLVPRQRPRRHRLRTLTDQ